MSATGVHPRMRHNSCGVGEGRGRGWWEGGGSGGGSLREFGGGRWLGRQWDSVR